MLHCLIYVLTVRQNRLDNVPGLMFNISKVFFFIYKEV